MSDKPKSASFVIGPWAFKTPGNELVHSDGHRLKLEDKIAHLLEALCTQRGDIISKEQLIDQVWQGRELSEQTIPVAISKLRKALGDDINNPKMLATIPRQGYQLLPEANERTAQQKKWRPLGPVGFAVLLIAILGVVYLWNTTATQNTAPDRIQFANSEKPGVIVTINDVRTSGGDREKIPLAIAISEMSSYYLSQVPDILVIRHWWNLDAPDPTGGIYTRHGPSTPVYSLKGTLIKDGADDVVSFVLSNPKNDEIIWSGMHPVTAGSFGLFPLFGTMLDRLQVDPITASYAPDETVSYWRARYFMQLSNPGAARIAASELSSLLAKEEISPAIRVLAEALAARWKDNPDMVDQITQLTTRLSRLSDLQAPAQNHFALVDKASAFLFDSADTKSAIVLLEAALEQAPGDHYALSLLAEAKLMRGDTEAAIAAYEKAFRLAPYAKAYGSRLSELKNTQIAQ